MLNFNCYNNFAEELNKTLTEQTINRSYNKDKEIRKTIKLLKEYIKMLIVLEEEQIDIANKIPFEKMNIKISMAIKNLEYQLEKEEQVRLTTSVYSLSELKSLGTNYLPGSMCFVLQDLSLYVLNNSHEWIQL